MKKISLGLLIVSILFFFGCADKESAEKILKKEGYTNITITGYNFFECNSGDKESTGFIAQKNGKVVEGTICEGMLLKNYTIKLNK